MAEAVQETELAATADVGSVPQYSEDPADEYDMNATGMSCFSVAVSVHEVDDEEGWLECGVSELDEEMALRKMRKDLAKLADVNQLLDPGSVDGLGVQDLVAGGGKELKEHKERWVAELKRLTKERGRLRGAHVSLKQDQAKIRSDKSDIIKQALRLLGLDTISVTAQELEGWKCKTCAKPPADPPLICECTPDCREHCGTCKKCRYLCGGPWMQCSASIDQLAEMSLQDIIAVQAGQPLPEVMDAMQALAQTIAQKDDAIAKMEAGLATVQERQRGHIGCLEEQVAMLQKTLEGYNERNGDGAETMPAAAGVRSKRPPSRACRQRGRS